MTVSITGPCSLDSKSDEQSVGVCNFGYCEPVQPENCTDSSECNSLANPCRAIECSAQGKCAPVTYPDGKNCKTSGDAAGKCVFAQCIMDREQAASREKKCRYVRGYYGKQKKCRNGLRFLLAEEKWEKERKRIRDRISNEVRYDMLVGLVELPTGGYNIITTNLRTRQEVRGLVDPSFVAFSMASFTASTVWKSRGLQIWMEPYIEGWTIPTKGSRVAQRKGMAASGLGFLGVVNVKEYRKWLEKTFRPLPVGGEMPGGEGLTTLARTVSEIGSGYKGKPDLCLPEAVHAPDEKKRISEMAAAVHEGRAAIGIDTLAQKGLIKNLRAAEEAFKAATPETQALCHLRVGGFKLEVADEYLRLVAAVVKTLDGSPKEPGVPPACVIACVLAEVGLQSGATHDEAKDALGACFKFFDQKE